MFSKFHKFTGKFRTTARLLNLALQGGGAHGAFTWGVLDRLLETGEFEFDGVSGTSAGAVNAVALAAGMSNGGPEAAREKLTDVWRAVSDSFKVLRNSRGNGHTNSDARDRDDAATHLVFDVMSRIYSPYDLDLFDFDPLRKILEAHIDFNSLKKKPAVDLIIAATDISTGSPRFFRNREITAETVLASACLPTLRKAVKIGRQHYWDGGFSSNPPLVPLVRECRAADTLLVKLNASREPNIPKKAQEISARANRLTMSQPLRSEIETIESIRRMAPVRRLVVSREQWRVINHRFHVIDAGRHTSKLAPTSKLTPDWDLICHLRDRGRDGAAKWLRRDGPMVGSQSSVELSSLIP